MQAYTEKLYKKDLHDSDNQVKWALGSITMNKASGGDGIPAELFRILNKFGKLSSGHRTIEKGQFSFQPQRRAMPKNVQTTTQLQSFHMLTKQCSKSFNPSHTTVCEPRISRCRSWI